MENEMRILICGDRKWTILSAIRRELLKVQYLNPVIIEGEADGADKIARYCAEKIGLKVIPFPADWNKYGHHKGSPAGPIRNRQMLNEGKLDVVWAFHSNIENSKGTKDMVTIARKAGLKVIIFKE